MTEILHITNGAVALSRIHGLGLPGQVVPWDDVLHEGPVPEGLDHQTLRRVRAAFLARTWTGAVQEVEQMLERRDRVFETPATEVVLWFEHDLYDQLQLLQVLDGFAARHAGQAGPAPRITAILADDYLTTQTDETLRQWYEGRRPLTAAEWAAAFAAWAAFRSANPTALNQFAHAGAWPALAASLRRHQQQFPSATTGLSRSEGQVLTVLADGDQTVPALFVLANWQMEPAVFMGDAAWWWHLRPLLENSHPLVQAHGDLPVSYAHPDWWRDEEPPRLGLTALGRRIVTGDGDHVALNGIDRWLGGVYLHRMRAARTPIWRWDEQRGILIRGS